MHLNVKRILLWPLLALIPAAWASAQTNAPCFSPTAPETMIELGQAFVFPLSVQAVVETRGEHRNTLNEFDLRVSAFALHADTSEHTSIAGDAVLPIGRPFRRLSDSKPGYCRFDRQQNCLVDSEVDWLDKKNFVTLNGELLASVQSDRRFAELLIQSEATMNEHDVLRLGEFVYQTDQPGAYRIKFELSYQGVTKQSDAIDVYFKCPDSNITLIPPQDKPLYRIEYSSFEIPLVSTVFFEKNSADYSFHPTDEMFRRLFMLSAVQRLQCKKLKVNLLPLYDRVAREPESLGIKRADTLLAEYQRMLAKATDGSQCNTPVALGELDSTVWDRYAKGPSEISQHWFSQENRAIPMAMDVPTQRVVLKPLPVKTEELSGLLALTVQKLPQEYCKTCIESGTFVLTNSKGDTLHETPPVAVLYDVLQGKYPFVFDSERLHSFLRADSYTAELWLRMRWPTREVRSAPVKFVIEPLNVIHDEIFALNQYDRSEFIYSLDSLRVDSLAIRILKAVDDTLQAHPLGQVPNSLILISGHACILGEQLYKKYYNLGLSMGRALMLRKLLLAALKRQTSSGPWEMAMRIEGELCVAKHAIARFITEPRTSALLEECFAAKQNRDLEHDYNKMMESMVKDKERHFESRPPTDIPWEQNVPTPGEIHQRVAALRDDIPGNLTRVMLSKGGQEMQVSILSAGFGVEVPFYRHCALPDTLQKMYLKQGYSHSQIPQSFFGDDSTASGRHMNRRVEVSIVWQY